MEKLYDLSRGTVRISIEGAEPEGVLSSCSENGIELWNTSPVESFTTETTAYSADLAVIRGIAMKKGCKLRIIESSSGGRFNGKVGRRSILLVGLVLCIAVMAASSLFIWEINIIGCEKLSYGEILRELEKCGVQYGAYWPSISSDEVKNEILTDCPEISWISLNMSNSRVNAVIHERINKPEIVNEAVPCDIAASKTGVITRISVLQGRSAVCVGDTVCEGDILVSGIMDSETAEDRYVHAQADIEARTWYEISAVTPLTENKKTDKKEGRIKVHILFGKNRINFLSDSRNRQASCDKINKINYLSVKGVFTIPIGFVIEHSSSFYTEEIPVDRADASAGLRSDLLDELMYRIGDGEIVSVNYSEAEADGILIVTLRAECVENIGVANDRTYN